MITGGLTTASIASNFDVNLIYARRLFQSINTNDGIETVQKLIYDKECYLEVRAKNTEALSGLGVVSRFIFLDRKGFNGLYRVNKKVSKELKNVTIKHQDYKAILKTAKRGDFIYFGLAYCPINRISSFMSKIKILLALKYNYAANF